MNPLMPVKDVPTSSGILAISYPHCSPDETSGLPAPLILINTPIDVLSAVISKPDLIFVTDNFVGDTEYYYSTTKQREPAKYLSLVSLHHVVTLPALSTNI